MEIVSTMGSGSLGRELDLDTLVRSIDEYVGGSIDANFTSNGMVTVRLSEDSPAYTIYRTGTFQIRGAKNEAKLIESEERFQNVISDIGVEVCDYKFRHITSVFIKDLGQSVNLEAMTIALGMENTEYEPEQFPGLVYRPSEYEVTLLIFASGKVIIGGTTDKNKAQSAVRQLKRKVDVLDIV